MEEKKETKEKKNNGYKREKKDHPMKRNHQTDGRKKKKKKKKKKKSFKSSALSCACATLAERRSRWNSAEKRRIHRDDTYRSWSVMGFRPSCRCWLWRPALPDSAYSSRWYLSTITGNEFITMILNAIKSIHIFDSLNPMNIVFHSIRLTSYFIEWKSYSIESNWYYIQFDSIQFQSSIIFIYWIWTEYLIMSWR